MQIADRLREARLHAFLTGSGPSAEQNNELDALVARTAEVYAHSVTDRTRVTYARRWALFERWCAERAVPALPASPETAMLYLTDAIKRDQAALSTLRGWMAAINRVHVEAGLTPPGADPAMTMFMRGLSRVAPPRARSVPMSALRIGGLRDVCRSIEATAVDATEVRDRALLGLHGAGIGDGELARLDWSQVALRRHSIRITILPVGRQVAIRHRVVRADSDDDRSCPVAAMRAWKEVVGPEPVGRVFRLLDRGRVAGDMSSKCVFWTRRSRCLALGTGGTPADPRMAMRLLGQWSSLALRDRAMLLVGFAGAFRRNEVSELRWSDIRERDAGLVVHLRRSKTDLAGRGRDVGIPFGKSSLTCPVTALRRWRLRVEEQLGTVDLEGPVFVHVGRPGRIKNTGLTPEGLTTMVRRRVQAAGLDGRWGGRSLRAGFISTAADLEIPLEAIALQSRHATLQSLIVYIRREDPFRKNVAARVGL